MKRITVEQLIQILHGDRELVVSLIERGVIEEGPGRGLAPEQVERALVSRTLVRELDVNLEGVEVILHLRERVLATQKQVGELVEELRRRRGDE
jgi:hypothetical protein